MNKSEHFSTMEEWDEISAVYQARRALPTDVVSLGALVADEMGLTLLGEVRGKRVLDLGCGGGQNCIALAKAGAIVAGVDGSAAQIAFARELAAAEGVEVDFTVGDVRELGALADGGWEIVLSMATLHYLADPQRALAEARRALAVGGRLVVSVDHPVRAMFHDGAEEEMSIYPVRDYFSRESVDWRFPETGVRLRTWHYSVAEWVRMVQESGLTLIALLEPPAPQEQLDALWPEDDALAPLRLIPHTLLFVATKTG